MKFEIPQFASDASPVFLEIRYAPHHERRERIQIWLVQPPRRDRWIGCFDPVDCGPVGLTIVQLRDVFLSNVWGVDPVTRTRLWSHPVWTEAARHIRNLSEVAGVLET